jgi:hypothetical protein
MAKMHDVCQACEGSSLLPEHRRGSSAPKILINFLRSAPTGKQSFPAEKCLCVHADMAIKYVSKVRHVVFAAQKLTMHVAT